MEEMYFFVSSVAMQINCVSSVAMQINCKSWGEWGMKKVIIMANCGILMVYILGWC